MKQLIVLVTGCAMVLGAAAVALGTPPSRASACSWGPFNTLVMRDEFRQAAIVAVGELSDPANGAITLTVEEGLKGANAGDRVTLNNSLNLQCYEALEPGRQNYKAGDRVFAVLLPDTMGIAQYKVFRSGNDIFRINGDVLEPYFEGWPEKLPAIADVRAEMAEAAKAPFQPGLEDVPPCNPPAPFEPTAARAQGAMAEAIVLGTVLAQAGPVATVRVDEAFRGAAAGSELRVNMSAFYQLSGCGLTPDGVRWRLNAGTRIAAMLVPDESGLAGWRPAVWGRALWEINGEDRTRYAGVPLLSEVRALFAAGLGPASATAPAPPTAAAAGVFIAPTPAVDRTRANQSSDRGRPSTRGNGSGMPAVAGAAAVVAAATLAAFAWRWRRGAHARPR